MKLLLFIFVIKLIAQSKIRTLIFIIKLWVYSIYNEIESFFFILANNNETLSDALKRDAEICTLKGECKRYENMIKVQETTIINMGQEHEVCLNQYVFL